MKRKKIISFSALLMFSAMILSGCGNDFKEVSGNSSEVISSEISDESFVADIDRATEIVKVIDDITESLEYSGVIYVSVGGEEVYNRGFGYSDSEESIPNDSETLFKIASDTKQFTASAIMILQSEGKLSVNDSLDKYFGNCKYADKVTIHNLLSMRSGIPDYMGYTDSNGNHLALSYDKIQYDISDSAKAEDNISAVKNWILSQELLFEPDEKFEYSNSNYFLLADIIEKVSGTAYEDFITEKIFRPLGMNSSGFTDSESGMSFEISPAGYEYLDYPGMSFGAGNIVSTVKDLSIWLKEISEPKKVLSEDIVKSMTVNNSSESDRILYGYGFMLNAESKIIYHAGYLPPYGSMILFSPKDDISVIMLSNNVYGDMESIGFEIYNAAAESL